MVEGVQQGPVMVGTFFIRVVDLKGGGRTLEALRVRVTLVEDEGPQPPPLVEEEHPFPHLRVSRQVKTGRPPPRPALAQNIGCA